MTEVTRIKAIEDSITATAPVAAEPITETPAAPVADDDDEEDVTEATAAPDGSDAPAPRKNKGVGKRINELTREKYEALREAEQLRRENEALRNPQQQRKPQPQQARTAQADETGKPTLEGHDFDQEAYSEALADWKVEQKFKEREDQATRAKAQKTAQEKASAFKDREAAFAANNPDYYDLAYTAPINYSEAMLGAIQESDEAPAIAYYLAQHLDEAADIAQMTPFAAAKAIGRIEAQLSAPASTPSQPRTVQRAPPIAPTIQGTAIAAKTPEAMTVEDHMAQLRAKRSQR